MVKELPNEKSPGPNGFNNEFLKNYWPIIGKNIKELIQDFYEENISLESINSSFITLIPQMYQTNFFIKQCAQIDYKTTG